ncbi:MULTISPECIES: Ig-like domain-containing protein [unclassified Marinobacterium]|uniref:Ig-like domain-containing protein n=1 Tax=unclassified Marinobacterium TaxID=2644139 RepID=UPI001569DAAE|nr:MULTISPECIES: Ig-like domain-containing protein [unclassified Marinobacterium]NRP58284.1 hypothetical protein [Marinobacterium sp. xm-d-510]NRP97364.1 hypothetical protein [Marinobacterium sp. xm-a-127]
MATVDISSFTGTVWDNTTESGELLITAVFGAGTVIDKSLLSSTAASPYLYLNNAQEAQLDIVRTNAAAPNELVFSYTVFEDHRSIDPLVVQGFYLDGATLQDSDGERLSTLINTANNQILVGGSRAKVTNPQITDDDLQSPTVDNVHVVSGNYRENQTVLFTVEFDESVFVTIGNAGSLPQLTFVSDGEPLNDVYAIYNNIGSGTRRLQFELQVTADVNVADLQLGSLLTNGAVIEDTSGNMAILGLPDLPAATNVSLGPQGSSIDAPEVLADITIESIRYLGSTASQFLAGDIVDLTVRTTGKVDIDESQGTPSLVLRNGGFATYLSGSGSDTLTFRYVVQPSDRDTAELTVLGVAENDAVFTGVAGQSVDLRLDSTNNLPAFETVQINARAPYITAIYSNDGQYSVGDHIEFQVHFSEAIENHGSGQPSLGLSNGSIAEFTRAVNGKVFYFTYTAQEGDTDSADLDVLSFNPEGAEFRSFTDSSDRVSLGLGNIASIASEYDIQVDVTRPVGEIRFDSNQVTAGETVGVTVTFDEPVTNPRAAIAVEFGTLSNLVNAAELDGTRSTTWKGVFTPTLDLEITDARLTLDNSRVSDAAGNAGAGLSTSNALSIDTLGPIASFQQEILSATRRLISIDFAEEVAGFDESDIVFDSASKSRIVTSGFTTVEPGRVYTIEVESTVAEPVGDLAFSIAKNRISDNVGNLNTESEDIVFSKPWDVIPPAISSITPVTDVDPTYGLEFKAGETLYIDVEFTETVNLDNSAGEPFLALSNGQTAEYYSGSETDSGTLRFKYTVELGERVDALNVTAFVRNNSLVTDDSGNEAKTTILPGANLADWGAVELDSTAPTIVTISAGEDKLYLKDQSVELTVQFSEDVFIDGTYGSPILALSNGAVAEYVSGDGISTGSGTSFLNFRYTVASNDFDSQDLDVHALIANGSILTDSAGNEINPKILSENSRLSYRSDVVIDAAVPYFSTTSVTAGHYKAGDVIDIVLGWNKPVEMHISSGDDPELKLSNGEIAVFNPQASSANRLAFTYVVKSTDAESGGLTFELRADNVAFKGVVAGETADLTLPNGGALEDKDGNSVQIDLTPPTVESLTVLDNDGSSDLSAGETATVSITFDKAVKEVRPEFFAIDAGALSHFETADSVTWTAIYTPNRGSQSGEREIAFDSTKVSDLAGNFGQDEPTVTNFTVDTLRPTVEITSDVTGVAGGEINFVIRFSEPVSDFDQSKVSLNAGAGTIDKFYPTEFDESGLPIEFNVLVVPTADSNDAISIRVMENVAKDSAGNYNRASDVFVQRVDTTIPVIESIYVDGGAYKLGDTVTFSVRFSEEAFLRGDGENLFLHTNNVGTAKYTSGAGTDTWNFEYIVSEDTVPGQLTLNNLVDETKSIIDIAGNAANPIISDDIRDALPRVIIDTTGPKVDTFSVVESTYNASEANPDQIGKYNTDDAVWIKMRADEWLTVDTSAGRPTLELSNGGEAVYVSGSHSNTLLFRYDVRESDSSSDALSVNSVRMNGAAIIDHAGNLLNGSQLLTHEVLTGSGSAVKVDTDAPIVETVSIVETTATNDTGAQLDAANDGYYKAGTTIAFEVAFDTEVFVDLAGAVAGGPVLALSNGQLAYYIEGDGTDTLRFEYTVAEGDINSDDLEVLGLAEQGAALTDDAGNPALVEMVSDKRNYTTAVVDTQAPELIAATDSFTANDDGVDVVKTLETVSFTFEFSEVIDWILATDQSIDPSDTAAIAQLVADNEAEILDLFSIELIPANNAVAPRAYEDGNGELVAMPAPTPAGAGWNAGLVADNFRFELNEQGEMDLTRFSVDVQIPDLTYADLKVSIASDALGDFAQNLSESDLSHTQRVDTQSFELNPSIVLGFVVNSDAQIDLLDKAGNSLLEEGVVINIDPATGKASIVVSPSETYPAGYRGPVILEVRDENSDPDYIDEYTGEAKDLDTVIRAMFNVTGPGAVDVTVSPLTELAVAKFLEGNDGSYVGLDEATVNQYNEGIGSIFGLGDITATTPVVTNAADVEVATGLDLPQPGEADVSAEAIKYGQVLAMLSARDYQNETAPEDPEDQGPTDSVARTIWELSNAIVLLDGQSEFAITQAGADLLVQALEASSSIESLDSVGVNRDLMDLAYMDAAAASGFGLNLAEAETATLPIKGAQLGDTVFVRWGNIVGGDHDGEANIFKVVIDVSHIAEDGSISVPVPMEIIKLQGDADSIPVSFAIAASETQVWQEADFSAPILVAVDIVPPVAAVSAPTFDAPLLVNGSIEGIRPGDKLNVLLNNSADDSFKYSLDTSFLEIIDGVVSIKEGKVPPSGFSVDVSAITYNSADGTLSFAWSLDLTQAIAVSHSIDSEGNKLPTFVVDDPRAVFEVQASTADLVGNPAESSSRNEFIIGSVDNILPATAATERAVMNELLDRLSGRYGDTAVDTRDKIITLAEAVKNLSALQAGTAVTMVQEKQILTVQIPPVTGTFESMTVAINIGGDELTLDLTEYFDHEQQSPTGQISVADIVDAIKDQPGYADKNYTVALSADGNSVEISYKAFGPQPESSAVATLTQTLPAAQIDSTIDVAGDIANFAVQSIAVDGVADENGFAVSPGQVRLEFGDVVLTVDVSEVDLITDLLAQLQAADAYADLPFALTLAESGDSLVATWERVGEVTDTLSLNRDYVQVTTSDLATFTSSPEGVSGITTAQLEALDIQNVDDTQMGAINRVLADQLANTLGQATIVFTESALVAGESSVVTISFPERVGQLPDDILELVGGNFTAAEGAPIWSSTDGINWTATFTASSTIVSTSLRYEKVLDSEGAEVLDSEGHPKLQVVTDTRNTPPYAKLGANDLMTVAVVEALVNKVTTASALIHAYSSAADAAEPGLEAFADIGLAEVRADNLSAVLDSLARVRDGFEVAGDLFTQIETLVDSYNAIFDTVYAETEQPTPVDLIEDLNNIGVSNLSSNAGRAEDQTTLLQGALREVAAAKADVTNEDSSVTTAAEQQADMINSVAKLESFVSSVEKVLARANGETVDIDGTATPLAVSDTDLTALGFGDLLQDESANSRLSALQKVLLDQSEGEDSDAIVNYADLKAVLNTASDAFDAIVGLTATAQDDSYVDADARAAAVTAALAEVDADSFQNMGIDGVTDVNIGAMTGDDMAAAVKDALANTPNDIVSLETVQTLVDSYTAILATAQSGIPSFDEADLVNIGIELTSTTGADSAQVAILQDFLATLSLSDVARLDELQAEVDLVDRVLTRAAGDTDIQLTDAEYVDLDIQGATADNLPALQKVLSDLGSVDSVSTLANLQSKLNTTVQAFADITEIAGQSSADTSALTATTFANMGIDALDDTRLAVTLSALKNTSNATTLANVQAAVDAINSLLDIADSDTGAVSAQMLTAIGLTPVADQTAQTVQLTLVGDLLAAADESDFASVADINELLSLTTALFANVDGDAGIAQSDLEDLGVSGITANNLSTLQAVLKQQTDLSAVADLSSLQSLMETAISTHAQLIAVAGDVNADTSAMDAQTFVDAGLDVTAGREDAVLSALKSTNETLTTGESIQAVFNSMKTILDVAATDTGGIAATDLTKIGVTLRADTAQADLQADLVSEIIAGLDETDVSTVAQIAALTAVTDRLIGTVNDETDVTLSETDTALLGLSIDASNLRLFNEALGAETDLSNVEDLSEIAAIASSVLTAQTTALAKISAYIDDNGNAQPTVDDLREAGLELSDGSRITEQLMPALLQQLNTASGSYTSFADIQGLITDGSAQLLALAAIAEYAQADGVDVAAPSLTQYQAAGITDFGTTPVTLEERHVAVANEILAHSSIGTDSGEDLATLTESAVQSLVDLVAEPLPTVASIDSISTDTSDADNAGGSATDFITSHTGAQTISATLSAELKAWQLAEYRIDDGAWTQIADTFITGTAISFGSTAFSADATYTLEIRVKDLSGEASAAATQDIVVDTTNPTAPAVVIPVVISDDAASVVEATAPEGVITVQGGQGETLEVTLTSDASSSTSVTKTLSANDGSAQKLVLTAGDVNNLGTGTITVSVTSTDLAGNQTTSSDIASFSLDADRPNQPTLSRDGNVLTIVGEDYATVVLMDGSTDITDSFDIIESPAGTYTATAITDAFDGTENLSITAALTDAAGNLGYASTALAGTGILDTTAPDAPVLTAVVNSGDASYDEGFTVTENADVVVKVDGTALTDTELATYFTKLTANNTDTYTAVNAKFAGTETISVTAGFTDSFNNTTDVTVALQEVKPVTPTQTITFDSLDYTVTESVSGEIALSDVRTSTDPAIVFYDFEDFGDGTYTISDSTGVIATFEGAWSGNDRNTNIHNDINRYVWDAGYRASQNSYNSITNLYVADRDGADMSTTGFKIELGGVISTDFSESDFIVNQTSGLTVKATLSAELAAGHKLMYFNGAGEWVDISSSVSGTSVSYLDPTLTQSAAITLKIRNALGEETVPTGKPVVIDTVVPDAPSLAVNGAVSGALTETEITSLNATEGLYNVSAEEGTEITLTFTNGSNEVEKTLTATGGGQFVQLSSADLTQLTDGRITVSVVATDDAGNVSTAATSSFVLDTTPPATTDAALTSDSGTANDSLTNSAAITAPTNAETQAVVEYRVLDADNSDAVVTDWSTSYIAPTTDGNYKVEVRQTDEAGNISTVQTITFEYDSTIPMPDALITTDSGSSATDGITDTAGITAPTNTGSDTLQYRILNAADDSVVSDWAGTYTAPTTNGSYKVEVKHTDAAGNTATQMINLTLDTAVDLSVSVAPGTYGVGDSVAITLTSASGETGITFSAAKFNGVTLEGVTDNGNGTYSATYIVSAGDTEVAAGGDVTVDFQFTDVAGNSDSLTSVTLSNNVAITPAALALEAFEEFVTPPVPSTFDMGSLGNLILPVTVDGGRVYYLLDRNGDNAVGRSNDGLTLAEAQNIFKEDVNGNVNPDPSSGPNVTYRYATINGARFALAIRGGTGTDISVDTTDLNTSVSGNEDNPAFDGGLYAIVDAFNGLPNAWTSAGLTDYVVSERYSGEQYYQSSPSVPNAGKDIIDSAGVWGVQSLNIIIEALNPTAMSTVRLPAFTGYLALGIDTYNDGSSDLPLTQELVSLANEIVSGITGTLSASAIQAALDAAHAKLTAMQVVLDYIDDQGSAAPDADDYNAIGLGRTVAVSEVAALNAAAVSAGVNAADTPAELAALLPVPSVTIDAISDDTSAYPPMADLAVAVSTDPNRQQGDVLIDISSVQVGDYLTLELNGATYTSDFAVPAPGDSIYTLQYQILQTFRGGNPEPAALTTWKAAVGIDEFYSSGSEILVRPTATDIDVSALNVKAGIPSTPDFITSDDDGLTITATLDAALATGQRLEFSTNGTDWTDISDSVTGTAVSYDASSLTSTATVQMRVVNSAGTAGTVDSQLITIDTAVATPNATLAVDSTNGVSGNDSDAVTNSGAITAPANAESGAIVEYRVQKDAGAFSSWSETYTAPATDGSADGAYVVEVRQTDVAGNVSASQSLTFTLDTTAPTTAVTAITISDDSGVQGDFITNDVDGLTISATLSAALATGEILEYWNGAAWSQVAATAISSTAVSFSDANLNSDTTVKFRVSDAAGNTGAEFTQAITFDTTAPVTAPLSITDVDLYSTGGTVRVNLDTSSTSAGDYVQLDSADGAQTITASVAMSGVNVVGTMKEYLTYDDASPDVTTYTLNSSHNLKLIEAHLVHDAFYAVDTDGDGIITAADQMTDTAFAAAGYREPISGLYLDEYFGSNDLINLINANEFLQNTAITYHCARYYDNAARGTLDNPQAYFIQWDGSSWSEVLLPASTPAVVITQPSQTINDYASDVSVSGAPSLVGGNTYEYDVSYPMFDSSTSFSLLQGGVDSGITITVIGTPGSSGAKISFTVPVDQTEPLTLTNNLVTLDRESSVDEISVSALTTIELTANDITNGYVDIDLTSSDLAGQSGAVTLLASIADVAGNKGSAAHQSFNLVPEPLELDVTLISDTPIMVSASVSVVSNGIDTVDLSDGDILRVSYTDAGGTSGVVTFPLSGATGNNSMVGKLADAINGFTDFSPAISSSRYITLSNGLGAVTIDSAEVITFDDNHISSQTIESAIVSIANAPDGFYNKQIEYSLDGGSSWTSSSISNSGYLSDNRPWQMITFASALTDGASLKIRVRNDATSEYSTTIVVDTTNPNLVMAAQSVSNASDDVVVQSDEKGFVYLINDNNDDAISTFADIVALADDKVNRVAITSTNTDTNLSTEGLAAGTYYAYAMDEAGNLSATSSNAVTVTDASPTDTADAVFKEIITGTNTVYNGTNAAVDDSGVNADATPDIVIKLVDIAEGDSLELVVDGVVVSTHAVTGSDITSGEVTFAGVDVAGNDASSDRSVSLGLKVTHITETQQVDTWEFNW